MGQLKKSLRDFSAVYLSGARTNMHGLDVPPLETYKNDTPVALFLSEMRGDLQHGPRFSLYDSVCALFYATPNSFARTQGSKGSKGSKTLSCINHGQAGQGHFRWSPWWSMWLQDTLAIVLSRFNDNQWTPFVVISGTEPGNALPSPSETSVDHTGPTHHHGWDLITLRVLVCIYIYIYMY